MFESLAVDSGESVSDLAASYTRRRRSSQSLINQQVPCPGTFRNKALDMAGRWGLDLSSIVESAMMLATDERLAEIEDPGEPLPGDVVVSVVPLANGQQRTFRRKPVLKIRAPQGLDAPLIRRLLAFALALDDADAWAFMPMAQFKQSQRRIAALDRRVDALVDVIKKLHPGITEAPPTNLRQAASCLNFPNEWCVDEASINKRFRELAMLFHPDTGLAACEKRMNSLIEARRLLLRFVSSGNGSKTTSRP